MHAMKVLFSAVFAVGCWEVVLARRRECCARLESGVRQFFQFSTNGQEFVQFSHRIYEEIKMIPFYCSLHCQGHAFLLVSMSFVHACTMSFLISRSFSLYRIYTVLSKFLNNVGYVSAIVVIRQRMCIALAMRRLT